jgi:hypothetical protein
VIQADARTFEIPEDVAVLFLNNPFRGALLEIVIGNLCRAVQHRGVDVSLIYGTPDHFERVRYKLPMISKRSGFSRYHEYGIYQVQALSEPKPRSALIGSACCLGGRG